MSFYGSLKDCYETVVAAMASQIEMLQSEVHYKQKRIEQLELQNEAMKIKLESTPEPASVKHFSMAHAIAPVFDSSKDPFEEVGAGE